MIQFNLAMNHKQFLFSSKKYYIIFSIIALLFSTFFIMFLYSINIKEYNKLQLAINDLQNKTISNFKKKLNSISEIIPVDSNLIRLNLQTQMNLLTNLMTNNICFTKITFADKHITWQGYAYNAHDLLAFTQQKSLRISLKNLIFSNLIQMANTQSIKFVMRSMLTLNES